jgi:hypothetical protein
MSSTLGGDDEAHDFTPDTKNKLEKALRKEGEELRRTGKPRDGQKKKDRANEISRAKSKKAHQ